MAVPALIISKSVKYSKKSWIMMCHRLSRLAPEVLQYDHSLYQAYYASQIDPSSDQAN